MGSMDGKIVIVTGSNTGIGKATAEGLVRLGAHVVMACRDVEKARVARDEIAQATGASERVEVMQLDLGSFESIRRFAREFQATHARLDVLVNNAGLSPASRRTTKDGLEQTFGVNHVGTFLLTHELLPVLQKSAPSRVVVVSSALYKSGRMDWNDLQFEKKPFAPLAAYNQSKLANVLFTQALSRRLAGSGVTVNALHPGVVSTELVRDLPKVVNLFTRIFFTTPAKGARTSIHLASSPAVDGVSGKYFEKSREVALKKHAAVVEDQERLWTLTEALIAERSRAAA